MLEPKFTITNKITAAITAIERIRGFLEAVVDRQTFLPLYVEVKNVVIVTIYDC